MQVFVSSKVQDFFFRLSLYVVWDEHSTVYYFLNASYLLEMFAEVEILEHAARKESVENVKVAVMVAEEELFDPPGVTEAMHILDDQEKEQQSDHFNCSLHSHIRNMVDLPLPNERNTRTVHGRGVPSDNSERPMHTSSGVNEYDDQVMNLWRLETMVLDCRCHETPFRHVTR